MIVEYANGTQLAYSLNAFMPYEGYRIVFNGTRGRLEHDALETPYLSGDGGIPGLFVKEATELRVFPHFAKAYNVPVAEGEGGHGGGDELLLADLLAPSPPPDPLGRAADHAAGAWSVLVGIAANRAIETGETVRIAELVRPELLAASRA